MRTLNPKAITSRMDPRLHIRRVVETDWTPILRRATRQLGSDAGVHVDVAGEPACGLASSQPHAPALRASPS